MKQKGKTWKDAKGIEIPEKYVTPIQRLQERNAQKIAGLGKELESKLRAAKIAFVEACTNVFINTPEAEKSKSSFSFTSFDKEFKIEWSIKENHVRVYEATRANPSAKDYRLLELNLNGIKKATTIEELTGQKLPAVFDGMAQEAVTEQPSVEVPDEDQLNDLQVPGDNNPGTSGSLFQGQD